MNVCSTTLKQQQQQRNTTTNKIDDKNSTSVKLDWMERLLLQDNSPTDFSTMHVEAPSILLDWKLQTSSSSLSAVKNSDTNNSKKPNGSTQQQQDGTTEDALNDDASSATVVSTENNTNCNMDQRSLHCEDRKQPSSSPKRKRDAEKNCDNPNHQLVIHDIETTTATSSATISTTTTKSSTTTLTSEPATSEVDRTTPTATARAGLSYLPNKKLKNSTVDEENNTENINNNNSTDENSNVEINNENNNNENGNVFILNDVDPSIVDFPPTKLLPNIHPDDQGKKCLVLDLDETLIHSSILMPPGGPDIVVQLPVENEERMETVYIMKRPGVDQFLLEMVKHFELVIFTAGTQTYADPLLDLLDPNRHLIRTRLYRDSCLAFGDSFYVKDLSLLGRDLSQAIIVDNYPMSYAFHQNNAIDCTSFYDDRGDRELEQIGAFLTAIKEVQDVRTVCRQWREWPNLSTNNHNTKEKQSATPITTSTFAAAH